MDKKKETITIRTTEKTKEEIKRIARDERRSISDYINLLLEKEIEKKREKEREEEREKDGA
jgi:hypothetical protein